MLHFIVFVTMSLMILLTITYHDHVAEGGGYFGYGDLDIEAELLTGNRIITAGASNQTTDGNMTGTKFLSIQNAQSGSISQINETSYTLELNDVSEKTILFSDRPDRIVTSISTSDFVGSWSAGPDSFAADAPNAVLVTDKSESQDTTIIELFNPFYDNDKNLLKYYIIPVNSTSMELPKKLGQSTIIIDAHPTVINSQMTD